MENGGAIRLKEILVGYIKMQKIVAMMRTSNIHWNAHKKAILYFSVQSQPGLLTQTFHPY
jgi:hypothetical protein